MTKAKALHDYFSRFGIDVYVNTSVPVHDNSMFPYLTYQFIDNGYTGGSVFPTVQIWYKTDSESVPNAKAKAIYDDIGEGKLIPFDGGYIRLDHGNPWCVSATGENDSSLKLRQLNITMTYYCL